MQRMLLVKRNELIAKELLSAKVQISKKPFEQEDELQEYKDTLSQCCRNDGGYDEVVKILRENPSLLNAIVSKNVRERDII
jgi:outer membrane protein assembly factor BamA